MEIIQILNTFKTIIQTLLGVIIVPTLFGSKMSSPFGELLLRTVGILKNNLLIFIDYINNVIRELS